MPLCEILLAIFLTASFAPRIASAGDQAKAADVSTLVGLLELVIEADAGTARQCLRTLADKIQSGEVDAATTGELKKRLAERLGKIVTHPTDPLSMDCALLASLWQDAAALAEVRNLAARSGTPVEDRQRALSALVFAKDPSLVETATRILNSRGSDAAALHGGVLSALSRSSDPAVADVVLSSYPSLAPEIQPQAVELLTQRAAWAKTLLEAIGKGTLPANVLNVNQAQKLLSLNDKELSAAVTRHWGQVRTSRDPARESLVAEMRKLVRETPGDPQRGIEVFNRVCGQCHKIHGQGQEVGPDITANGRASFEQLLSNVFDPSLVIGASYQARTVRTVDGRVVTGLLAEDSPQRVVLKIQGGKQETIAREDVEAMKISELSLMPEGLEKQLKPQEVADLFAFITLDKHPDDKSARPIPGTPEGR